MTTKIESFVDSIEVAKNGIIQVRTRTDTLEDDVVVDSKLHRHIVVPGADYSKEDPKVQEVSAVAHTPEVIAAYEATFVATQK